MKNNLPDANVVCQKTPDVYVSCKNPLISDVDIVVATSPLEVFLNYTDVYGNEDGINVMPDDQWFNKFPLEIRLAEPIPSVVVVLFYPN
jgi:hypothetical protein